VGAEQDAAEVHLTTASTVSITPHKKVVMLRAPADLGLFNAAQTKEFWNARLKTPPGLSPAI